jgi:hypothetical protein
VKHGSNILPPRLHDHGQVRKLRTSVIQYDPPGVSHGGVGEFVFVPFRVSHVEKGEAKGVLLSMEGNANGRRT